MLHSLFPVLHCISIDALPFRIAGAGGMEFAVLITQRIVRDRRSPASRGVVAPADGGEGKCLY